MNNTVDNIIPSKHSKDIRKCERWMRRAVIIA